MTVTFLLPAPVWKALDKLENAGFAAYVVGGCVRDWALGTQPHDFDICTAALPEDMRRIFRDQRTIETGLKHGTLTVMMDQTPLEITTFRLDGEYLDGRHPASVQFTDRIEADLSRRDFTINAMAYSPRAGLVDPFGGQADCRRGIIRCVGAPERRFSEDALRILRALRFSARLGFPIEERTDGALRAGRSMLQKISRERIAAELTGLLMGKDAGSVLCRYPEVIVTVLPEMKPLTESGLWRRALKRIDRSPRDEIIRWAALLMDAADSGEAAAALARDALKSLKMSNKMIESVSQLSLWKGEALPPEHLQEMLMRLGPEALRRLIRLQAADGLGAEGARESRAAASVEESLLARVDLLLSENACYTLGQLAVNGRDMARLGLGGADIGRTLEGLLLRVVRGELPNDRDALLREAQPRESRAAPCGS